MASLSRPRQQLGIRRYSLILIPLLFCTLSKSGWLRAASTTSLGQQISSAFSQVGEIKKLTLSGTVTRYLGSSSGAGNITLIASDDGSGSLSLQTTNLGNYSESEDPASLGRTCSWQDSAGNTHAMDYSSCAVPLLWFMPSIALQPGTVNTVISDQGNGELAGLQARILSVTNSAVGLPNGAPSNSASVRVGLDPATLLPVVMEYQVHPDTNAMANVKVDITYGNWSVEQGIEIPHSIQRRINGALDMDIKIQNVTLN